VTLSSIAVTTNPANTVYIAGETLDLAGLVVTATYSDNSTATVTITAAMLTYDFSTAGTNKTVTITCESRTATVTGITVEDFGPKADYFGTWRQVYTYGGDAAFWVQIIISSNKIVYLDKNGYSYTLEGLTWTERNNPSGSFTADYPTGYRVTGTMARNNSYNVPKAEGSGNAAVGEIALNSFYISADKQIIRMGNWQTAAQEAVYGPYNKKTDVEYWNVTWNLNGGSWQNNPNHVTEVAKDGKIAAPRNPTKAGYNFGGWFSNAALLGNSVTFPYTATGNTTLYAKWDDTSPSVTLRITVSPGAGWYNSLRVDRVSSGSPAWYTIPTSAGTHTINVSPGTYRITYSYMSCSLPQCLSTGWSPSNFTVSAGQSRNITIVGASISF
jgi:uncharacterized repeat protein (TIGR02543 family)